MSKEFSIKRTNLSKIKRLKEQFKKLTADTPAAEEPKESTLTGKMRRRRKHLGFRTLTCTYNQIKRGRCQWRASEFSETPRLCLLCASGCSSEPSEAASEFDSELYVS